MMTGSCKPVFSVGGQPLAKTLWSTRVKPEQHESNINVGAGWSPAKKRGTSSCNRSDSNIDIAMMLSVGQLNLSSPHQRKRIPGIGAGGPKASAEPRVVGSAQLTGPPRNPSPGRSRLETRARQIGYLEFDVWLLSHVVLPRLPGKC